MSRGKPVEINAHLAPTPSNPHSWLALVGDARGQTTIAGWRVMFGNLRVERRGYRNSLAALAKAKIAPVSSANADPWTATAHRVEVLLPGWADDALSEPRTLIERAEADGPDDPKGLGTYITLTSYPDRLHAQFEVARMVSRRLVERFGVAVLLVQHDPSRAANANPPHCHLVVPGPRRVTAWSGFGAFVSPLSTDKGRDIVIDELEAVLRKRLSHGNGEPDRREETRW